MTVKSIKLNNGMSMPEIGLGTWKANETGVLAETVKKAVELGYRHIDCAKIYNNQCEIGKALKEVNVPRNELFIVSKIFQNKHRPELVPGAVDEILSELGIEYLDLLLMHWPYALVPEQGTADFTAKDLENVPIMDTWKAMEAMVDQGKVRSIGVSNFNKTILEKMLPQCRIKPVTNQVEVHPYNPQNELVKYCQQQGIVVTAYCPLGGGSINVMHDDFIKRIADAHSCTPAQVSLSWLLARGLVIIPKSNHEVRLKQNLHAVTLTSDEIRMIGQIKARERKVDPSRDIEELKWIFHEDEAECPLI
ncbi:hypothetical protein LPJ78_001901 [Coemansia sp. RSA 989]|nr:pol-related [Coemansia mojavensis]KAJ1741139.1 hypothetical protein LPJ68_003123 [Coemansia sp. RSA 1086]KAJ1751645.1 hypothetical protein LPJ79_001914 [Coemansia sp. RSA 1821]KAJ1866330.1 hypothetical protein LPJ78_001901 [Coemansia sp. RSA 989]KAJ1873739.1 hypothetical protein LPJ55_002078 [Coemansia sp. RSA 990]KAJ2632619.1 hypothetical protein H4R22_001123 [Coemansia sp. RSA 1290]KAJ2653904.1 hypothetical protein IWW40_000188 [Coemansia sp. RSA 1250]KAJ2677054.1 hypothetical protein I